MKALKTLAKGLVLGASIFAIAGVANAATPIDFNVYGASAQFNFWNAVGGSTGIQGLFGCSGAAAPVATSDGKSVLTVLQSCSTFSGSPNINFRYSSKASYDGIDAIQGTDIHSPTTCTNKFQRPQVVAGGAYACQDVHLAASDVAGESFQELSTGSQFGPLGGPGTTRDFITHPITVAAGTTVNQPFIVPFAFYVNTGVTSSRCGNGATDVTKVDQYCLADADCGAASVAGTCAQRTIDNLGRIQAVALFSSQIQNWNQFGGYFPNLPVTVCLRHAGSGTHATLDLAVVKGNGWGGGLLQAEFRADVPANVGTYPYVYFNDGTSDLQNCLNWAGGTKTDSAGKTLHGYDAAAFGGAVGYMDADTAAPAGTVGPIKFAGVAPSRIAIRDGLYENFYTFEHAYLNPAYAATNQATIYNSLINYIGLAVNLNVANLGATKAGLYTATEEANFTKGTDATYPSYFGATNQQNP